MATIKFEQVSGQLIGLEASHSVRLKLTVREEWAQGSDQPPTRILEDIEPLSLSGIKDGTYTLQYFFSGKQEQQAVRISYGFMLEG